MAVPIPTGFKVGGEGAEWALPGGARVSANAGAELRVIGAPQQLALGGKRSVPSYTVVLKSGILRVHVPADGSMAIVVSAPQKSAVLVTSGDASVVAGPQLAVANNQGNTQLGLQGQHFHAVPAGMVEVVGAPRRPLLAPPAGARLASVQLSYGKPVELESLAWAAVPNAQTYRVELRDERSHRVLARNETRTTVLPAGFAALEPGSYTLRLAAVDAVGLESVPVTLPLHVVGVDLPAGAFVDAEGAVRFPPAVKIQFVETAGVEMSFGHTDSFIAAPPSVGLFRSEPIQLRFRAAGSIDAQVLYLTPRTTHASVKFGPRAPSWPGAPLQINVSVEDPSASLEWLDVKPYVSVGVEPVAVDFKREGSAWHGVLSARAGKGPWVVRVEVKDQNGITLGRDFVEIAEGDPVKTGDGT